MSTTKNASSPSSGTPSAAPTASPTVSPAPAAGLVFRGLSSGLIPRSGGKTPVKRETLTEWSRVVLSFCEAKRAEGASPQTVLYRGLYELLLAAAAAKAPAGGIVDIIENISRGLAAQVSRKELIHMFLDIVRSSLYVLPDRVEDLPPGASLSDEAAQAALRETAGSLCSTAATVLRVLLERKLVTKKELVAFIDSQQHQMLNVVRDVSRIGIRYKTRNHFTLPVYTLERENAVGYAVFYILTREFLCSPPAGKEVAVAFRNRLMEVQVEHRLCSSRVMNLLLDAVAESLGKCANAEALLSTVLMDSFPREKIRESFQLMLVAAAERAEFADITPDDGGEQLHRGIFRLLAAAIEMGIFTVEDIYIYLSPSDAVLAEIITRMHLLLDAPLGSMRASEMQAAISTFRQSQLESERRDIPAGMSTSADVLYAPPEQEEGTECCALEAALPARPADCLVGDPLSKAQTRAKNCPGDESEACTVDDYMSYVETIYAPKLQLLAALIEMNALDHAAKLWDYLAGAGIPPVYFICVRAALESLLRFVLMTESTASSAADAAAEKVLGCEEPEQNFSLVPWDRVPLGLRGALMTGMKPTCTSTGALSRLLPLKTQYFPGGDLSAGVAGAYEWIRQRAGPMGLGRAPRLQKAVADSLSVFNGEQMAELLAEVVLPSFTLAEAHPVMYETCWKLLRGLPDHERFSIYRRTIAAQRRHAFCALSHDRVRQLTSTLLKRVTALGTTSTVENASTSASEMASLEEGLRQISSKFAAELVGRRMRSGTPREMELSCILRDLTGINPFTAFTQILRNVEIFKNITSPLMEFLRLLHPLAADAGSYLLMNRIALCETAAGKFTLGQPPPLKLTNLAHFSARYLRRHPGCGIRYVVLTALLRLEKEATHTDFPTKIQGYVNDIVFLSELLEWIGSMPALEIGELSAQQRHAFVGGPALRALVHAQGERKEEESKPGARAAKTALRDALWDPTTFRRLICVLERLRLKLLYDSTSDAVGPLSRFNDAIRSLETQLFDFLQSVMKSFASFVAEAPRDLLGFLDLPVAWEIFRHAIPPLGATKDGDLMSQLQKAMEPTVPPVFRTRHGRRFFFTFWRLQVADLYCPSDVYQSQMFELHRAVLFIQNEKRRIGGGRAQREVEKTIRRLEDQVEGLQTEWTAHRESVEKMFNTLKDEAVSWFSDIRETDGVNSPTVYAAIVIGMLMPRIMNSLSNAIFCAKFIEVLDKLKVGLDIKKFTTFWTKQLTPMLRTCTELEANLMGTFASEALELAIETAGKTPESLPFLTTWDSNVFAALRGGLAIPMPAEFAETGDEEMASEEADEGSSFDSASPRLVWHETRTAVQFLLTSNSVLPATSLLGNVLLASLPSLLTAVQTASWRDVEVSLRALRRMLNERSTAWVHHPKALNLAEVMPDATGDTDRSATQNRSTGFPSDTTMTSGSWMSGSTGSLFSSGSRRNPFDIGGRKDAAETPSAAETPGGGAGRESRTSASPTPVSSGTKQPRQGKSDEEPAKRLRVAETTPPSSTSRHTAENPPADAGDAGIRLATPPGDARRQAPSSPKNSPATNAAASDHGTPRATQEMPVAAGKASAAPVGKTRPQTPSSGGSRLVVSADRAGILGPGPQEPTSPGGDARRAPSSTRSTNLQASSFGLTTPGQPAATDAPVNRAKSPSAALPKPSQRSVSTPASPMADTVQRIDSRSPGDDASPADGARKGEDHHRHQALKQQIRQERVGLQPRQGERVGSGPAPAEATRSPEAPTSGPTRTAVTKRQTAARGPSGSSSPRPAGNRVLVETGWTADMYRRPGYEDSTRGYPEPPRSSAHHVASPQQTGRPGSSPTGGSQAAPTLAGRHSPSEYQSSAVATSYYGGGSSYAQSLLPGNAPSRSTGSSYQPATPSSSSRSTQRTGSRSGNYRPPPVR